MTTEKMHEHYLAGKSLKKVGKLAGLHASAVHKRFLIAGLPIRSLSEAAHIYWQDPVVREEQRERGRKRWEDPIFREKATKAARKRWEDPVEHRKMSEAGRKRYEDPAEHEKLSKAAYRRFEDPVERERVGKRSRKYWKDPDERKKMSEIVKKLWQDPDYVKKMSAAWHRARKKNGRVSKGQKRLYKIVETLGVAFDKEQVFTFDGQGWAVIDVYVPSVQLAIEYDGHHFHRTVEGRKHDMERDIKMLSIHGVKTLRIGHREIFTDQVISRIAETIKRVGLRTA